MIYSLKLKEIREINNDSQEKIANTLGIARVTYNHYETQYQIIPITHLINFSSHYKVSLDYILGFTQKKNYNSDNQKVSIAISSKRLKEFRKEQHLTQEKLGNLLNTTKTVICGYEHERCFIATPFLYTICQKYKISADYLLGKTDEPKYLNDKPQE